MRRTSWLSKITLILGLTSLIASENSSAVPPELPLSSETLNLESESSFDLFRPLGFCDFYSHGLDCVRMKTVAKLAESGNLPVWSYNKNILVKQRYRNHRFGGKHWRGRYRDRNHRGWGK